MSDPKMFEVGPDGLCEFERLAIETAERLATRWDLSKDQVHDAKQEAWYQARARKGTPGTVAWRACLQVLSGRGLGTGESARSIDHPNPVRQKDGVRGKSVCRITRRGAFHVENFAKEGEDPAEIVAFEIDFTDWQARLEERKRKMVEAFLEGLSTRDAASLFEVSPGRISQIRRELEQEWDKMFADED